MKNWKNIIYYSQCWEDPNVLLEGLDIQRKDKILSVTSGGCNTLTLLLQDPEKIIALDINPTQNHLLELKILAIKYLPYDDLLAFLGIGYCKDRIYFFNILEPHLSNDAKEWWKSNLEAIKDGVIHCGKLERYFKIFRNTIVPLIHSKSTVIALFSKRTTEEQLHFYNNEWNTWRWRLLFRIFFSKKVMSVIGRNPDLFKYVDIKDFGEYYLEKTKKALCDNPSENFFLFYIFVGNYDKEHLPLYLKKENISIIESRLDRIYIVSKDIKSFFEKNTEYFNKYNLSNIFETSSSEFTLDVFSDIISHSNHGSRLVYINHMVERTFPEKLSGNIGHDTIKEKSLGEKNMAFFYKKIHIDYIK